MALLHQVVADNFAGPLDPARWEFTPAGAYAVPGGRLETRSPYYDAQPGLPIGYRGAGEVWSVASGTLEGSFASAEIIATDPTASGITHLAVFTDSPHLNAVAWRASFDASSRWGFTLRAVRIVGEQVTVLATMPPDEQSARFVRISQTAGVVTWSVSSDGLTWTPVVTWNSALNLTAARVALGSWYTSPGDVGGGRALFDSLNADPTAGDAPTVTGEDGQPYLAVDVQPDDAVGAFRVGTSVVGGPDRLAWSLGDVWTGIVCNVRQVGYQRGASRQQGVLTRTEAGTGTVLVEDPTGRFDPNTNGGRIRKGTPIRLRAWGTDPNGERWDTVLFTGELDDLAVQYVPGEDVPLVTLMMVDLVGPLAAWESEGEPGDGVGGGDNLLERTQRVLQTVGRGTVSYSSSPNYVATLVPTPMRQPWLELNDAAEAELGRLWIDRHNRVQLRSRGSQPSGPIRGTLSSLHGEAPVGVHGCVADAAIVSGSEGMANRVVAARTRTAADRELQPATVQLEHEQSQRQHGVATVTRTSLPLETDAQVEAWAGALITARTRPELRVDSVSPLPSSVDLDSALEQWPAVLGTDLGDRWLFIYHPPAGPPIVRGLAVLGISLTVAPDGWELQWTTEPAPVPGVSNPTGWFVVGTSVVGGPDLLAPYSAPYLEEDQVLGQPGPLGAGQLAPAGP
jgi:hypothetical protein